MLSANNSKNKFTQTWQKLKAVFFCTVNFLGCLGERERERERERALSGLLKLSGPFLSGIRMGLKIKHTDIGFRQTDEMT